MKKSDIELWARNAIEVARKGQNIEEDNVEFKAAIIDAKKAARRIAGLCNTARGEPALLIFGVDEKGSILGVAKEELSTWFDKLERHFDGFAPQAQIVNIAFEEGTVVALCLETDRTPYVVKDPKMESADREVPWRTGNRTLSATRAQLLQLLVPLSKLPGVDALGAFLRMSPKHGGGFVGNVQISIFVTQPSNQEVTFAQHLCSCVIRIPGFGELIAEPDTLKFLRDAPGSVVDGGGTVVMKGSGKVILICGVRKAGGEIVRSFPQVEAEVSLNMTPAGSDKFISLKLDLRSSQKEGTKGDRTWGVGTHESGSGVQI